MNTLILQYNRLCSGLGALAPALLPTLARLTFAAVLLGYFWASAKTKLGDGLFTLSDGAYSQIFPRAFESAGFDSGQLGLWPYLVSLAGTYAEFVLPALITIGLFTRLAALGMIAFIALQSLTDIFGHKVDADTIGHWFDRAPDALILDQRAFWVLTLATLVALGAGPLSLDRVLRKWQPIADT
jgi:putative oxidoreductase